MTKLHKQIQKEKDKCIICDRQATYIHCYCAPKRPALHFTFCDECSEDELYEIRLQGWDIPRRIRVKS